mgnify:CR=1
MTKSYYHTVTLIQRLKSGRSMEWQACIIDKSDTLSNLQLIRRINFERFDTVSKDDILRSEVACMG